MDEELIELLEDVDTSKVKLWLFTNAYVNHARRVCKLLGVDRRRSSTASSMSKVMNGSTTTMGDASITTNGADAAEEKDEDDGYGYFEGLTYCDYGAATNIDPVTGEMEGFVCKPHQRMFEKAMREAGIVDPNECYFVGMLCLCFCCAMFTSWLIP